MGSPSFRIRAAQVHEVNALSALCLRSKAHWGYDATFIERCRDALTLTPARLQSEPTYVAVDADDQALGVVSYTLAGPKRAEIELLFVDPKAMGRGVGRALLEHVRREMTARGVRSLWVLSDPQAERFYVSMGAIRSGLRPSDCIPERTLPWLRLGLAPAPPPEPSARLILRRWREDDRVPFAALNADPRVAKFMPSTLDRAQSDARFDRLLDEFERYGFGLWAVERTDLDARPFIGFVGLMPIFFEAPFAPTVEIGWRLAASHWGVGLATEAARAVVTHAFNVLELDSIVSFTVPHNLPSRRVMEKLGMRHNPDEDFDHPSLENGHALQRHVLYRLANVTP